MLGPSVIALYVSAQEDIAISSLPCGFQVVTGFKKKKKSGGGGHLKNLIKMKLGAVATSLFY